MLFTVSWNVLVGVAAVTMLVVRRRQQRWRSSYQEIGGGGITGKLFPIIMGAMGPWGPWEGCSGSR